MDLSAALNTIDHNIPVSMLQNRIGVTGPTLDWFHSYLEAITKLSTSSENLLIPFRIPFVETYKELNAQCNITAHKNESIKKSGTTFRNEIGNPHLFL